MPYVHRNQQGQIDGYFSCSQPGYAYEYLDENAPEIIAYLHPPVAPQPTLDDVIAVMTPQQKTALQERLDAKGR